MDSQFYEDRLVTYTLEYGGEFVLIEHVPARVNVETGEQFFAPDTLERLQKLIWRRPKPVRTVQTPVFEFIGA